MHIQSPLSNLREILAKVKSSAQSYQNTLATNEAATRAVLIDPILRALGWDTANTFMVEVEKTLNQTRADYALYDNGNSVKCIIEAKKLGDNLNSHDVKLVNYAFTFKLASIFLTDGIIWLHYTDFQPTHFAPTRVLNIKQDDLGEIAAYLVQHLDAAIYWPEEQTVDTLSQQISDLQQFSTALEKRLTLIENQSPVVTHSFIAPISKTSNLSTTQKQASAIQGPSDWIPIDTLIDIKNTRPSRLKLPDDQELTVSTWNQVLIETSKFVLANNPNIPIPLPDRSGMKVNLFNLIPPPQGISYATATYNGMTIYIYTNYAARNVIANTIYIMKQLTTPSLHTMPCVIYAST